MRYVATASAATDTVDGGGGANDPHEWTIVSL